jgi:hypothetical protein
MTTPRRDTPSSFTNSPRKGPPMTPRGEPSTPRAGPPMAPSGNSPPWTPNESGPPILPKMEHTEERAPSTVESREDFLQFTSLSFVHRPNFRLISDEALHRMKAALSVRIGTLSISAFGHTRSPGKSFAIGSGFAWILSLDSDKEDY